MNVAASERRRARVPMRAAGAITLVALFAWCGCQRQPQEELLSADGRAAYQRGLAALRAKQWDLAIKHFREIGMGPRAYPPLLRDLGLAYAGAGHEAEAVAWLQAYVVADPRASDAPAMRAELGRVEAAGQGKVRDLLEQALAAIESLPDDLTRDRELSVLAHFTAAAGEITRALEIERRVRRERVSPPNEAGLWADYAQGLAREGDLETVQDVLAQLTGSDDRDHVFHGVAMYFFEDGGDAEAARKAARQIQQAARRDGMIALIDRHERDGTLRARSRPTVATVIRRAQAVSALQERRLAHRKAVEQERQQQSPSSIVPLPRDLLSRLLGEQALNLAVDLRALRVQARKIACCLERP